MGHRFPYYSDPPSAPVNPLSPKDDSFLREAAELFRRHNNADRFGIFLDYPRLIVQPHDIVTEDFLLARPIGLIHTIPAAHALGGFETHWKASASGFFMVTRICRLGLRNPSVDGRN